MMTNGLADYVCLDWEAQNLFNCDLETMCTQLTPWFGLNIYADHSVSACQNFNFDICISWKLIGSRTNNGLGSGSLWSGRDLHCLGE